MIEVNSNNVRHIRPLSPAEKRAREAWFRDRSAAQIVEMQLQRGGRFCVVQGDYSGRTTQNIRQGLQYLAELGAHQSPAARFLALELARRSRGQWGSVPVDPDGPRAA